jgi:hypothetical protein
VYQVRVYQVRVYQVRVYQVRVYQVRVNQAMQCSQVCRCIRYGNTGHENTDTKTQDAAESNATRTSDKVTK